MISADSPLHQLVKLPPPDNISRKPKKDIWTSLSNLSRRDLENFAKYTTQSIVFCLLRSVIKLCKGRRQKEKQIFYGQADRKK